MHKDAFLFAQGSSLPSCHTCPGTEPAARQLALQGPFNPPDLTEGSITLEFSIISCSRMMLQCQDRERSLTLGTLQSSSMFALSRA